MLDGDVDAQFLVQIGDQLAKVIEAENPFDAQRAFLAAGGPDQDRLGLDPDGDGFVCGWSPLPYRSLQSQSNG